MQLIVFTHGIGNFHPNDADKVALLEHMQQEAERCYGAGNAKVVYAPYEQFLDKLEVSKISGFISGAASTFYSGTPILGRLLADYGDDIAEYYFSQALREKVSHIVISEIASELRTAGLASVTGITLIGHSLGSLVMLRVTALLQTLARGNGPVTVGKGLIDEILFNPTLHNDVELVGRFPIQPVLFGSPAFSRVPTFKQSTRMMAVHDCDPSFVLHNQVTIGHPIVINAYSRDFLHDPLSGPVEDTLPAVNIAGSWTHIGVAQEFSALMDYFVSLQPKQVEEPKEAA
ncbi:MAG TPA: hypothetical protein VN081_03865 [Dongiaceae bacterium]|nr:hypothetical protein [Dongiaceae bacterium]